MATGKRPPSGIPGARRKRPAPTIDLTATEIAAAAAATTVPPEPVPQAAANAPPPEPPVPPDPPSSNEPPRAAPEPPPFGGIAWLPHDFPWPAAVAGALGAAAVLLVAMLIWLIMPSGNSGDAVATLTPRLAAIETQLRELAARPAPATVNSQALDALTARFAKLEAAVSAPRPAAADPALAGRIAALEGALKPLSDSIAALGRRADESDAAVRAVRGRIDTTATSIADLQTTARTNSGDHGEIAKLSDRVAGLEKSGQTVAEQLAKHAAAAGSDRPVRLAVTTSALRAAIDKGDPFVTELAALRPLTTDATALAALEPFAATGVPSAAALGRELLIALPVMRRAAGASPREGGLLDRLQANAEKLVRIRPIEEVAGEDTSAILSRLEVKAAHTDVNGALAELGKLQPAVRAPALAWIAKAEARNKAVDASRRLAADAIAALKTNP